MDNNFSRYWCGLCNKFIIVNYDLEGKVMNDEVKKVYEKFKEVKNVLKNFSTKDEAIEYLVNETKLLKEECSAAYDIIMKIND